MLGWCKVVTIMSKCTRVQYNEYTLNIVDTPGHADFGGEVERVLSMVDGVILVIDATEGPMPQTKFVLNKALSHGLRPVLVINKVDRVTSRIFSGEVQNETFDLFMQLEANEDQLEFPILFASARNGWAVTSAATVQEFLNKGAPGKETANLKPLFEEIIRYVRPPVVKPANPFSMLVTSVEYDNYVGKICTGRIYTGSARFGDMLCPISRDGKVGELMKVMKVYCRRGTIRDELEEACAGDIVSVAGVNGMVGDTITSDPTSPPISSPPLDAPTICVTFGPNTSPLNGKEGKQLTSAVIRERLFREAENNVAIQVFESPRNKDAFEVHGRGELQMGILLETMRREGFELSVSPPQVLFKVENGVKTEPVEEVIMEIDMEIAGLVMDKMKQRGATLLDYKELPGGTKNKLVFHCPSRTLMGYRSEFKMDSKGTGIMYSVYHSHMPYVPSEAQITRGGIISTEPGTATSYALESIQSKGVLFIENGTEVYEGMIIGENSRGDDLAVNPTKKKQLSNVRTVMKEDAIRLFPPRLMPLEEAITYIKEGEIVEVTPKSIRLRKVILSNAERLRAARNERNKL